jgi:MoxR-like ATPase
MRITLGYPDAQAERALLLGQERRELLMQLPACLMPEALLEIQAAVSKVHVAPVLLDYLQAVLTFTRQSSLFRGGLSPRAGLALLKAARAWALLHRRNHLLPEDVQAVLPAVIGHRLQPGNEYLDYSSNKLVEQLLNTVGVPA